MAEASRTADDLRALRIVVLVAVVCALVVATAAVLLRPFYQANLEAARAARLSAILSQLEPAGGIDAAWKNLESRVVELETGRYVEHIDPLTFDAVKAANDAREGVIIPDEVDIAGIDRRARHAVVYVLRERDRVEALVLPVWGSGYQSTLRGYLALDGQASTVLALQFYEQGDTPGLGARIQDPAWEAEWPGKPLYDAEGVLRLGVSRPGGDPRSHAAHRVDGISGATRTSMGVDALLRFWLGELGFGPFLSRVRAGEA